jgi:hypothetical protein
MTGAVAKAWIGWARSPSRNHRAPATPSAEAGWPISVTSPVSPRGIASRRSSGIVTSVSTWVWPSMKPGTRTRPVRSSRSVPRPASAERSEPTAATRSPATATSQRSTSSV